MVICVVCCFLYFLVEVVFIVGVYCLGECELVIVMDEFLGYIVNIEEEEGVEDDVLDVVLDLELVVIYVKYFLVSIFYLFDVVVMFVCGYIFLLMMFYFYVEVVDYLCCFFIIFFSEGCYLNK